MKRLRTFLVLLATVLMVVVPDLASAQSRTRIPGGSSLPATCAVNDYFTKTGSGAGLYRCSSTNTWSLVFSAEGVVPPANLGTGSSITTKFLRGDGTWQTLAGGGDALVANGLDQFAATTLANFFGVISNEGTGVATALAVNVGSAGAVVVNGGALGTPSSGTLTSATGLPVSTGISGLGTGVATALAVNVGSAGAPVVLNGALGTPSSGTGTNLTGIPIASGISGLGTGIATALAVNTGSAGAPVLVNGALGTPTSGTATNITGLPPAGVTFAATDRFLCRDTASGGAGEECTGAAAAGIIGLTNVLALYTGTPDGTKFLRDDGAWTAIAGGGDALVANPLSQFAETTSSQLKGVLSDELGSASGKVIFSEGALAVASGKTLTVSHTMTLAGGDSSVITFPNATATALTTNADVSFAQFVQCPTNTFVGNITAGTADNTCVEYADMLTELGIVASTAPPTGTDLGAAATAFRDLYLYGAGTYSSTSLKLTGTPTGNRTITFPDATFTVAGLDTTGTFTNKTFDAEGTGNVLTIPTEIMFNAGVCQNATASVGFSTPSTLGAAGGCHTVAAASGDPAYGFAIFPTGGADTELHGMFPLSSSWTGTIEAQITWNAVSTTANDVVWEVAFGCVAAGEAATTISFNETAFTADTNLGTTLQLNKTANTTLTTTGCAAGEMAYFVIHRDTDTAGDTLDADVNLISIVFTVRKAM